MTIITNAVALMRQHDFDYDIAYLSAWYGSGETEIPTATPYQILYWMEQVKHIPHIEEAQAEEWLTAYARVKKGIR